MSGVRTPPGVRPESGRNGPRLGTAFTVSIEASEGVTTGISAQDRAHTIRVAPELLAQTSATSDVHEAILDQVNAGWSKYGPQGKFRSAQMTVRINPENVRELWEVMSARADELEDETHEPIVVTLLFHPHSAND